ncbi:MAG: diguanylate cyclase, partial [Oscillospiraceae bacterium]|nr:diguanylate cyclase [Oscillospiraceae bacterium]
KKAAELGIPVISVGMEIEGASFLGIDNEPGMRELVTHIVEEHDVKRVIFIGGTEDHVDCRERLRVTREVLESHGLTLSPEDTYYSDWGNIQTSRIVDSTLHDLPDAYVCANDIMALATITRLNRSGIHTPDDVIVTGFDNVSAGKLFYPALTTISMSYEEIGRNACQMIYESIRRGDNSPMKRFVPSVFIRGESCRCSGELDYRAMRDEFCRDEYYIRISLGHISRIERTLFYGISEASGFDDMKEKLTEFYAAAHNFEGKDYYIVMNKDYLTDLKSSESAVLENCYSKPLSAVVALNDGKATDAVLKDSHDIVPGYEKKDGVKKVFLFIPLHNEQYNFGYVALTDESRLISIDYSLFYYIERIQQAMILLRVNLQLSAANKELMMLYDKDPMTGLFNRFCYEKKAVPLFEQSIKDHTSMVIMFLDINCMKKINDLYGHIQGDAAILTVTDAIKRSIGEDWLAIRYGGDEFLVIGARCTEEKAAQVKSSITDILDSSDRSGTRPYDITVSCGYVLTDPESGTSLQDYIKDADALMYELKKKRHT